jgi:hypothetical protein
MNRGGRPDVTSPRIMACLREHGPQTMRELTRRLDVDASSVHKALQRILHLVEDDTAPERHRGTVWRVQHDERPHVPMAAEEKVPRARPSGVHRLPTFEDGTGERRDSCTHYGGCLSRFRGHGQAQCPSACSHFAERDHRADVDRYAGARERAVFTA